MGSGKSTVGKMLANTLKYAFFDTDSVIELAHDKRPVSAIFAEEGQDYFRQCESQIVKELSPYRCVEMGEGGVQGRRVCISTGACRCAEGCSSAEGRPREFAVCVPCGHGGMKRRGRCCERCPLWEGLYTKLRCSTTTRVALGCGCRAYVVWGRGVLRSAWVALRAYRRWSQTKQLSAHVRDDTRIGSLFTSPLLMPTA